MEEPLSIPYVVLTKPCSSLFYGNRVLPQLVLKILAKLEKIMSVGYVGLLSYGTFTFPSLSSSKSPAD